MNPTSPALPPPAADQRYPLAVQCSRTANAFMEKSPLSSLSGVILGPNPVSLNRPFEIACRLGISIWSLYAWQRPGQPSRVSLGSRSFRYALGSFFLMGLIATFRVSASHIKSTWSKVSLLSNSAAALFKPGRPLFAEIITAGGCFELLV
jgi:hypothetical protein